MDLLTRRHGEVVRETFQTGLVKKWSEDSHSHGAFVMHGVLQRYQYMVTATEKDERKSFEMDSIQLHSFVTYDRVTRGWLRDRLD